MLQLVIGNKNYSSWSMRPWVLMRQCGIPFDEIKLRFDRLTYSPDSAFYRALAQYTPVAKVPVLLIDGFAIWDTLAIAEAQLDLVEGDAELAQQHPRPHRPRRIVLVADHQLQHACLQDGNAMLASCAISVMRSAHRSHARQVTQPV